MIKSMTILLSVLATCTCAFAQDNGKILEEASALHRNYRFQEAETVLEKLQAPAENDMRARDSIMTSIRNGSVMMQYSDIPEIIGRINIGKNRPYQYLPSDFSGVAGIPAWNGKSIGSACLSEDNLIVFSVVENGKSTLYFSTKINGEIWNVPEPVIDPAARPGNCIYPVFNGSFLTFASDGLPGMGGYDLFRIRYDSESGKWGSPQNIGFPYSSTGNDLLYFERPQKDYTYFVSDRIHVADSLTMFISAYSADPVKREITDPDTAMKVSLYGKRSMTRISREPLETDIEESSEDREYMDLLKKERSISDEISEIFSRIESSRKTAVNLSREEDRKLVMQSIGTDEKILMMKQMELSSLSDEKQRMELDYMMEGKPIPALAENKDDAQDTAEITYEGPEIARHDAAIRQEIRFIEPEPQVDLNIKFGKTAEILDDSFLPENGIYYQIQLFTVASKTDIRNLKGIYPVFVEKTRTGKYIYRAGVFNSYQEASDAMKKVRSRISGCIVAAFDSGKQIGVQEARKKETGSTNASSYQISMRMFQAGIPAEVVKAIGEICTKDIARTVENGKTVYIIGPLETEAEAKKIADALENLAIEGVYIEKIK